MANPIYGVVFKYLININKCAKLLLSVIIGREVVSLLTNNSNDVLVLIHHCRTDVTARQIGNQTFNTATPFDFCYRNQIRGMCSHFPP